MERAFLCLSTKTAVMLMGVNDIAHGFMAFMVAALLMLIRTHEHKVDSLVVDYFATQGNATIATGWAQHAGFHANMTAVETEHAVRGLNHLIDITAQRGVPALLIVGAILCYFGFVGIKATTCSLHAKKYHLWKMIHAIFSILSCSPFKMLLSWYCALITRSHLSTLLEESMPQPVVVVVQVPAPAPQAAKTAKTLDDEPVGVGVAKTLDAC